MKKTFSLKLMLLGLLLSVSSGVWAQYIAKDGIIYKINGNNATVVGVNKKASNTKAITIPDKVEGKTVNAIAPDWVYPDGKIFQNTSGGTGTSTQPTAAAEDEGVSANVTTGTGSQTVVTFGYIDAKTIENLTLTFDASQIKEIDNNLVLDIQSLQVENFVIGENSGITVIPEQLFASSTAGDPIITWHYYGSDETTTGSERNAEKATAAEEALAAAKGNKQTEIENLTEALTNALNDKKEADAAVEAAEDALQIAEMIEEHPELMNTPELTKKQQAERLEAAIAAFKDFKTSGGKGYDDLLVPAVQEYTNVVNVSTWFVAYTLATEGVGIVGMSNATNIANLQALVDEVKAAYSEFYGQELTSAAIGEVTTYKFSSFGVAANANNQNVERDGYISETTYTAFATGTVLVGGTTESNSGNSTYTEVTVMEQTPDDGDAPFAGQKFYIKETEENFANDQANADKHYLLYTKERGQFNAVTYQDEEDNQYYLVVTVGEKKTFTLEDEAEIVIDAADPADDIAEAKAGVQSVADATKDLTDAQNAQAAAEQAVTDAQNALTTAQGELTALNNTEAVTSDSEPTLIVDLEAENETLKSVAFNNEKIEKIEAYAFYNCVEAEFTGTFPATLQKIEEKAFANTQFKNLDLSNTGTIDWRGDVDEDGNIIPDGVTDEQDKLGDDDIAADAFAGTPLETMLLAPTLLTPEWVNTVAQNLVKAEDPVEVEWCDAAEPVKVRNLNTTLTTAVLPDYEEFAEITDKTFFKNWALTSVTIPASVVTIGKQAFQYTNVPEFDLTNLEGLATIGAAAFSRNPSLTSVKFAEAAPLSELKANTFTGSCALEEVVFNDAMATLPEGLFQTNALKELNICNTQVTVLENLFLACPSDEISYDNPLWLGVNETLTSVCLPDGLEAIEAFALSSCWGLTDVEIPGNVETMGDGVFYNSKNIKEVTIMDSKMIGLPANTFKQCTSLEKLTFVTLETINPNPFGNNVYQVSWEDTDDDDYEQCFGDNIFFSIGHKPTVVVGNDSYYKLIGGSPVYAQAYSTLEIYKPEVTINAANYANGSYWKPYQSQYGTWIKAGENVIVYSAYQDGHNIILYPAKIKNGYYKIAAYTGNNDAAAAAVIRSQDQTFTFEQKTNPEQRVQSTLDVENQLLVLDEEYEGNSNRNIYYMSCAGSNVSFYQAVESVTLPEGFVCFKTEAYQGQGSRLNVIIVDEDEATAIGGIKEYISTKDSEAIYNLQGVRVNATQKGQMYIQGGKKFIQK